MNNFDLKNYFKKQYLEEGTCGYTPDGKPRSKPASSDLMKEAERAADKFNVNAFGYQTKYYKVDHRILAIGINIPHKQT